MQMFPIRAILKPKRGFREIDPIHAWAI